MSITGAARSTDVYGVVEAAAYLFSGLFPRIVGSVMVLLLTNNWIVCAILLGLVTNFHLLFFLFNNKLFRSCSSFKDQEEREEEYSSLSDVDIISRQLLGGSSLLNLSIFLLTALSCAVLAESPDTNSTISLFKIQEIIRVVFLPGSVISIVSSLGLVLFPASDKRVRLAANTALVLSALLVPVLGALLVSPETHPDSAFVLVKVSSGITEVELISLD